MGCFDLRNLDGTKLHASVKYTNLTLLERESTLIIERRPALIPALRNGVPAPEV